MEKDIERDIKGRENAIDLFGICRYFHKLSESSETYQTTMDLDVILPLEGRHVLFSRLRYKV